MMTTNPPFPITSPSNMRMKWTVAFFLIMYSYVMVKADWISDPDIFWHVTVGNSILSNLAFPHSDIYSHTMFGEPWIAKEWLSQIILAGLYHLAGWQGLAIFSGAICAFSLSVLFWRFLGIVKWTIAVGLVWIAMPLLALSFMARPQIFSFLLFAIALIEIDDALHEQRRPRLWITGLSILWVNLHASFPILVVMLIYGASEAYFRSRLANDGKVPYDWISIISLVMIGFCITPYGIMPLIVSIKILQFDLSHYITEWRPIALDRDYHNLVEFLILSGWLALICLACVPVLAKSRTMALRILPIGFFVAMTIKHVRFCTMLTLTAAVFTARAISEQFPKFSAQTLRHDRYALAMNNLILATSIVTAFMSSIIPQKPDAMIEPSSALAFAKTMELSGNVYNSYGFGGFLIAHDIKTMVDGRTELFFSHILRRMLDPLITNDEKAFRESVEFVGAEWALVLTGSNEARLFGRLPNWNLLYHDDVATLYQKTGD